jgi:hypothetical protein
VVVGRNKERHKSNTMMMRVDNLRRVSLRVLLEPLGEVYELLPGKGINVEVQGATYTSSDAPMVIVADDEDSITIYGWGETLTTADSK